MKIDFTPVETRTTEGLNDSNADAAINVVAAIITAIIDASNIISGQDDVVLVDNIAVAAI